MVPGHIIKGRTQPQATDLFLVCARITRAPSCSCGTWRPGGRKPGDTCGHSRAVTQWVCSRDRGHLSSSVAFIGGKTSSSFPTRWEVTLSPAAPRVGFMGTLAGQGAVASQGMSTGAREHPGERSCSCPVHRSLAVSTWAGPGVGRAARVSGPLHCLCPAYQGLHARHSPQGPQGERLLASAGNEEMAERGGARKGHPPSCHRVCVHHFGEDFLLYSHRTRRLPKPLPVGIAGRQGRSPAAAPRVLLRCNPGLDTGPGVSQCRLPLHLALENAVYGAVPRTLFFFSFNF